MLIAAAITGSAIFSDVEPVWKVISRAPVAVLVIVRAVLSSVELFRLQAIEAAPPPVMYA